VDEDDLGAAELKAVCEAARQRVSCGGSSWGDSDELAGSNGGDNDSEEDAVDTTPEEAQLCLYLCSALFCLHAFCSLLLAALVLGLRFLSLYFGYTSLVMHWTSTIALQHHVGSVACLIMVDTIYKSGRLHNRYPGVARVIRGNYGEALGPLFGLTA